MKKTVLLIVFLFLVRPIYPIVEYVFNYDYIIEKLCENKDKPQMHCNGKCHLMKELAKASKNENNNSQDKKTVSTEFEVLFFEKAFELKITQLLFIHNKKVNTNYSDLYVYQNVLSIFHPPIFVS